MKKIILSLWGFVLIGNALLSMDPYAVSISVESDYLNNALISTIRQKEFNIFSLHEVEKLLDQGANPHYQDTKNGMTPLMNAVQCNNLSAVRLLITKEVNVNAKTTQGSFARDFNMLYSQENIQRLLPNILTTMVATETDNISPEEKDNYKKELYNIRASRELRKALLIERILVCRDACTNMNADNSYLAIYINKDVRYKRALRYALNSDHYDISHYVPEEIQQLLLDDIAT
jgi:hypothetical protein